MEGNDNKKKNQQPSKPNFLHSNTFLLDTTHFYTLTLHVNNSLWICEAHSCNCDGMAYDQYPSHHRRDNRHGHNGRTHRQLLRPCVPQSSHRHLVKVQQSSTLYLRVIFFPVCFRPKGYNSSNLHNRGACGVIIRREESSNDGTVEGVWCLLDSDACCNSVVTVCLGIVCLFSGVKTFFF